MDGSPPPQPDAPTEVERKAPASLAPEDFYFEGLYLVFTAAYHLKRGSCCGSGCRHCPYEPKDSDGQP